MAMSILSDSHILPFSSEASLLRSPELFPTQDLFVPGLPCTSKEMKTQTAVDEQLLLNEEDATPLFQRRAASQQMISPSMLPRAGAMSRELKSSPSPDDHPANLATFTVSASTSSTMSIATSHALEFPPAPKEGRPVNFGLVVPGVYRSSYPKAEDYDFLKDLKLKTVVYVPSFSAPRILKLTNRVSAPWSSAMRLTTTSSRLPPPTASARSSST